MGDGIGQENRPVALEQISGDELERRIKIMQNQLEAAQTKTDLIACMEEEITRLRAQLAEVEGQEPVGHVERDIGCGTYELHAYREVDEFTKLYTHPAPAKVPDESELVHIGYTNGAQVLYCVANKSGSFYPDTENDSCIPVYMLRTHAHRLESTTNGEVTLDRIKREWAMLKSQGRE